jgi:indole-3-glycerol phosphate synthase
VQLAGELGLAALVEVHNEDELTRTLAGEAQIVGVNSRNLETFEVSLETALRLRKRIPTDCVTVAESGIHTRDDVRRLEEAGYDAILVGEALMRASDPGRKLAELLGGAS